MNWKFWKATQQPARPATGPEILADLVAREAERVREAATLLGVDPPGQIQAVQAARSVVALRLSLAWASPATTAAAASEAAPELARFEVDLDPQVRAEARARAESQPETLPEAFNGIG